MPEVGSRKDEEKRFKGAEVQRCKGEEGKEEGGRRSKMRMRERMREWIVVNR